MIEKIGLGLLATGLILIGFGFGYRYRESITTAPALPDVAAVEIQMFMAEPGDMVKRHTSYGLLQVTGMAYTGDVYEGVGEDTREGRMGPREAYPRCPILAISREGVQYTIPPLERVTLVRWAE